MLDNLTYEEYAEQVNTKFHIVGNNMKLELIEVTDKRTTPQHEMFSLVFSGSNDNFLEQSVYQMQHEKLGEGEIFIVPISQDEDGYKYEAAFNRMIDNKSLKSD
jgi:mannose-6-phosphate isomerase class I